MADQMQVIAQLTNQCIFTFGACQQKPVGGQWIERAKESQALDEGGHRGIDGDHTFCLELAERDMNGPLIFCCGAQAIEGEIGALADAHASMANQQKGISAEIVAAHELLLKELILLFGERPWQSLRGAWDVFAPDQMREFRLLCGPCQIAADGAQGNEPVDVGRGDQGWRLRAQSRHPSEDVRIAAQLIETRDAGVIGSEIRKEAARRAAVMPRRLGVERSAE